MYLAKYDKFCGVGGTLAEAIEQLSYVRDEPLDLLNEFESAEFFKIGEPLEVGYETVFNVKEKPVPQRRRR